MCGVCTSGMAFLQTLMRDHQSKTTEYVVGYYWIEDVIDRLALSLCAQTQTNLME